MSGTRNRESKKGHTMKFFNLYGLLMAIVLTVLFTDVLGQASSVCPCARNYMPVCGSNGRTYPNKCVFDCAADSPMGRSVKLRMVASTGCEDMQNGDVSADIFSDDE